MTKITDKYNAILNTALRLLVENGFHNTPMSLIAKEAGVSAGIIYHYFESKEDLINQLYQVISGELSKVIPEEKFYHLEGKVLLKQLWLDIYAFYVMHPNETLFMEQYKNSPFYRHTQENVERDWSMLLQKLEKAMAKGEIVRFPFVVLYDLTLGIAMTLAKRHIIDQVELDQATLQKIADAVCRAVQVN